MKNDVVDELTRVNRPQDLPLSELSYRRREKRRCVTCNVKLDRAAEKCALCLTQEALQIPYADKRVRQRSYAETAKAKRDPTHAKHCPKCHHFRHKKAYLKFNDPYGVCVVCRDGEDTERIAESRNQRLERWAMRKAEEAIKRYEDEHGES